MTHGSEDLARVPVVLEAAEIWSCAGTSGSGSPICGLVRERRGLERRVAAEHLYLRLCAAEGACGWWGPLDRWSHTDVPALTEAARAVSTRAASIRQAQERLAPLWPIQPDACAAVDGALWDLVCRSRGLPLWQALSPGQEAAGIRPAFYASALGLPPEQVGILREVLAEGFPVVKASLHEENPVEEQLSRLGALGIEWGSLALDAHGRLSEDEVERIRRRAPGLAWLEDPFPSGDRARWTAAGPLARLVTGEDVHSVERLGELSGCPGVHAVNLEVSRLGITRSAEVIGKLAERGRPCHLHGRALLPSSHLAAAYPGTVARVEIHLALAPERLATLRLAESEPDPRALGERCLDEIGTGLEPSRKKAVAVHRVAL